MGSWGGGRHFSKGAQEMPSKDVNSVLRSKENEP